MTGPADPIQAAALDWLVRVNDPDFSDWDDFTQWLEADPAHGEAYHQLVASEEMLRDEVQLTEVATVMSVRRNWQRWGTIGGGALAASLAIATLVPGISSISYETRPGEMQVVELGDGDTLTLNGDTRVSLSRYDRRAIRLDHGQVYLALDSDTKTVALEAGDLTITDIGTHFEVTREAGSTRIAVSEGAVQAERGTSRAVVKAGQQLDTQDGAGRLMAEEAVGDGVGLWQQGLLFYTDEDLAVVVADLKRSTALDFQLDEAIARRRFSGTLAIADVRDHPETLGPLLGVSMRRTEDGWRLEEGR